MLLFTGCAKQSENVDTAVNAPISESEIGGIESSDDGVYNDDKDIKKDDFIFLYNNVTICLDEYIEPILTELEPVTEYYEYQSCSFDGMAKIYSYDGFGLETYLKDKTDKDRVYSITFYDESVSTVEGIYMGQTFDDMISAYGKDYNEISSGAYRYERNKTILSFNIQDNIIISILYQIADININE
jgi:hypothetical protein